jgi:hypothetical protein
MTIWFKELLDFMERFAEILRDATAAVPAEYFLLPLHGADPADFPGQT